MWTLLPCLGAGQPLALLTVGRVDFTPDLATFGDPLPPLCSGDSSALPDLLEGQGHALRHTLGLCSSVSFHGVEGAKGASLGSFFVGSLLCSTSGNGWLESHCSVSCL